MTAHRVGSRPHRLVSMAPGDRLLFEVPAGRVSALMQQIGADIGRAGLRGVLKQSHILGIEVDARVVVDIVAVTHRGTP